MRYAGALDCVNVLVTILTLARSDVCDIPLGLYDRQWYLPRVAELLMPIVVRERFCRRSLNYLSHKVRQHSELFSKGLPRSFTCTPQNSTASSTEIIID